MRLCRVRTETPSAAQLVPRPRVARGRGRTQSVKAVVANTGKRPFEGGLCASLTATTLDEARRQVKQAQDAKADTVELRLDYLEDFDPSRDLETLLKSTDLPYIVTYRPVWEGGRYEGKEEDRLAVLRDSAEMGAPFVDIELKSAEAFFSKMAKSPGGTEFLMSHHDYEGTPSRAELAAIMQQMQDRGADIAKIATTATDITDSHRLLTFLGEQTSAFLSLLTALVICCGVAPAIVLGMGDRGVMTRVLARKYGGFLTFGALEPGKQTAPGQPTVKDLRELYRVHDINSETKVYGVIGNPVTHSKGPSFYNPCFQAAGYDAVYLHLMVDDFELFMNTFTEPDFAGYSVTIPHKASALRAASKVDELTTGIGACNCLVREKSGDFTGSNSDCGAAMDVIEGVLKEQDPGNGTLEGKTLVVAGAGGVAKALAYGAAYRGAQVIVVNRTAEKAQKLAEMIPNGSTASVEDLQSGKVKGDIFANGTSLGMQPYLDSSPVPKEALKNFKVVFDAVYTPRDTKLLREAEEVGCKTATGFYMFSRIGRLQFKNFTGMDPPREPFEAFLNQK